MEYKLCTKCNIEYPATEDYFYKQLIRCKTKPDYYKLSGWCIECQRESSKNRGNEQCVERSIRFKNWYENNKEYKQECNRNYLEENKTEVRKYVKDFQNEYPDKIKKYNNNHRNHDITNLEWENELSVFNHSCGYCGLTENDNKITYGEVLHKDHVDHEGANDLRNAIPACTLCNSKKYQYNMNEWYIKQEFFDEDKYNKILWWITEGYKQYIENKPPYIIKRKRKENSSKYNWQLWSIDDYRNLKEVIIVKPSKKDIVEYIYKNGI